MPLTSITWIRKGYPGSSFMSVNRQTSDNVQKHEGLQSSNAIIQVINDNFRILLRGSFSPGNGDKTVSC